RDISSKLRLGMGLRRGRGTELKRVGVSARPIRLRHERGSICKSVAKKETHRGGRLKNVEKPASGRFVEHPAAFLYLPFMRKLVCQARIYMPARVPYGQHWNAQGDRHVCASRGRYRLSERVADSHCALLLAWPQFSGRVGHP